MTRAKQGSVGLPHFFTEVRVTDDSGAVVPPEYYKTEWEPVGVLEGGMRRGGRPAARKVLTAA
jgi:hypothetical protein